MVICLVVWVLEWCQRCWDMTDAGVEMNILVDSGAVYSCWQTSKDGWDFMKCDGRSFKSHASSEKRHPSCCLSPQRGEKTLNQNKKEARQKFLPAPSEWSVSKLFCFASSCPARPFTRLLGPAGVIDSLKATTGASSLMLLEVEEDVSCMCYTDTHPPPPHPPAGENLPRIYM